MSERNCYLSTLELHELDEACAPFNEAFGRYPFLVGSASHRQEFRDVDVRLILADEDFDRLFGGNASLWGLFCRLAATYLRARTGLPVDFQVQRQTEANEKYADRAAHPRNPLGRRPALLFAGAGDATMFSGGDDDA